MPYNNKLGLLIDTILKVTNHIYILRNGQYDSQNNIWQIEVNDLKRAISNINLANTPEDDIINHINNSKFQQATIPNNKFICHFNKTNYSLTLHQVNQNFISFIQQGMPISSNSFWIGWWDSEVDFIIFGDKVNKLFTIRQQELANFRGRYVFNALSIILF